MVSTRVLNPNPLWVLGLSREYLLLLGGTKRGLRASIETHYKQLVVRHHPDKGGKPERFQAIQAAYEELKDDKILARAHREMLERKSAETATGNDEELLAVRTAAAKRLTQALVYRHFYPVNGRMFVVPVSVEEPDELEADLLAHDGTARKRSAKKGSVNYEAYVERDIVTITRLRGVAAGRKGPKIPLHNTPVWANGLWWEIVFDEESETQLKVVYETVGEPQAYAFVGLSPLVSLGEMLTSTEAVNTYGVLESGNPEGVSTALSGMPPQMLLPLVESLVFNHDREGNTLVVATEQSGEALLVVVGLIAKFAED